MTNPASLENFKTNPEIIDLTVMLYIRFQVLDLPRKKTSPSNDTGKLGARSLKPKAFRELRGRLNTDVRHLHLRIRHA